MGSRLGEERVAKSSDPVIPSRSSCKIESCVHYYIIDVMLSLDTIK